MSLLGSRGRFTKNLNDILKNINSEQKSELSLNAKNPYTLFGINYESDNDDFKEKIKKQENSSSNSLNDKYITHDEYNLQLNRANKKNVEFEDEEYEKSSKKINIKLIVAMFIVEIITLIGIYFVGSIYRLANMTQAIPFDIKKVENTEIAESTLEVMKGYKTVAVFGVDSRTGSVDKGNNADVNLIINLNLETGDTQLVSVYRDLYLSVTDNNTYDKLNAAYRKGGPEQAVKSLNKNLDLNIDSYFAFNWKAVADGVELLGGVDIDITSSEYKYMNAFIHETCVATGIDAKNPAAHYIKSAGLQHLDGVQTVAYGRLRLMDNDFKRVERQKKVIALCLEKAKQLDVPRLRLIVEAVLPQIAYAFDMNELISLLRIVRTVNITESTGFPEINDMLMMDMGSSGNCVVPYNLEKCVKKLHNILFNVEDYTTSAQVRRYGNRITELRKQYAEENKIKESLKLSSTDEKEEESEASKTSKNTTTNRKASSSNTKKNETISESERKNLPIDDTNYEEEPEEDPNLPISNEAVPVDAPSSNRNVTNNAPSNDSNEAVSVDAPTSNRNVTNNSPSDDLNIRYISPGVPYNPNSEISAPGSSNSGGGVVVSGPPGSELIETTPISPSPNNSIETDAIMPILGAPY